MPGRRDRRYPRYVLYLTGGEHLNMRDLDWQRHKGRERVTWCDVSAPSIFHSEVHFFFFHGHLKFHHCVSTVRLGRPHEGAAS